MLPISTRRVGVCPRAPSKGTGSAASPMTSMSVAAQSVTVDGASSVAGPIAHPIVISGAVALRIRATNEQALVKALPPGAFYTELPGETHVARTDRKGRPSLPSGMDQLTPVYIK
jgi:hypothetical protein